MKIKAKNPNIASMKLIVPIDGLITIDAKGEADVSAKCAVLLVNNTNDWGYVGKTAPESEIKENDETGAEGTENIADEAPEKSERELLEEKVKNSKVAELKEMCVEAEFPEDEWKNLSKGLLAAYILKKYDEATEASDEEEDEEED